MDLLALLVVAGGSASVGLAAGFVIGRRRGWRTAIASISSDQIDDVEVGDAGESDFVEHEVERPGTLARGVVDSLITESIKRVGKLIQSTAAGDVQMASDGTITLMFSDIEDSSTLNIQLGDEEWARVIHVHDELVRRIVRRNRGRVIKTLGDGFMAAFSDTERAVVCGLQLQDELSANEDIGHELGLRIGVHTGPAVSRDGDLFGENVVIAAGVGGAARAGDVLVSDVVRGATRRVRGGRVRHPPPGASEGHSGAASRPRRHGRRIAPRVTLDSH